MRLRDRVSIEKLHDKARLLILKQRCEKQLLRCMFVHLKDHNNKAKLTANTRSQAKHIAR